MKNYIPFESVDFKVGQKAVLYACESDKFIESQKLEDYDPEAYFEIDVIFMEHNIPYYYEKDGSTYLIGWDIYVNGIMPIAVKTIGEIIRKG